MFRHFFSSYNSMAYRFYLEVFYYGSLLLVYVTLYHNKVETHTHTCAQSARPFLSGIHYL